VLDNDEAKLDQLQDREQDATGDAVDEDVN